MFSRKEMIECTSTRKKRRKKETKIRQLFDFDFP
ncbi:unnamed protein product [Brugia timori]|uniref:Uncharacterized protein n=1 Tax=Brugia timori TaxID=42155 RepID=A0A0R3Q6T3_9BILA|nr:unnamed protein product [Brugia timori]